MLFARTTKQITFNAITRRLKVRWFPNLKEYFFAKKRTTNSTTTIASKKRIDSIIEFATTPVIKDKTKSRDPSIFCVNVNITASAFSNGNVAVKTGIILIQNMITARNKMQIAEISTFIIFPKRDHKLTVLDLVF